MKTALITGASSGIGLATAIQFAQAGFDVTATVRGERGKNALRERAALDQVSFHILQMDVTNDESVCMGVKTMLERTSTIDVLINNAGAGYLGTVEQTPVEDAARVMDVNFLGVWRTVQAVLPAMRSAGGGRILSVSSVGGVSKSGVFFSLAGAGDSMQGYSEITVFGDRGVLRTGIWGERLLLKKHAQSEFMPVKYAASRGPWEQFLKVRNGKMDNPCPPEIGLRFATLMDMIRESATTGRVVRTGKRSR